MLSSSRVLAALTFGLALALSTPAVLAQGAIDGFVAFWGDPGGGTQIEIAAHSNLGGPPDASVFVNLPGGPFSIPLADGTYYVSGLMARDGVFGQPRVEDVLAWHDADADGYPDTITVSGTTVFGANIDMGFVYVDVDATAGANNGSSWADAYTSYNSAMSAAVSGVELWVAEGTYLPGGLLTSSFVVKSGVRAYGGFAGGETVRQQRDWSAHSTVLSCELGGPQADDNCFHVVLATGANETAVLDGFTITRGYADGGGTHNIGGGINATGGGMTVANSRIVDNFALHYGGGIHTNNNTNVVAVNTVFSGNEAGYSGGGFYLHAAAPSPSKVVNCVFTGNTALGGGGLMVYGPVAAAIEDRPKLVNMSLSGNSATEGGGIYTQTSDYAVAIENSVLWGNTASTGPELWYETFFSIQPVVNYSIVQGSWTAGTQILDTDPMFADAELRIPLDSPAVDSGDSATLPLDDADLDENHRTDETLPVDMDRLRRVEDVGAVPDTGIPNLDGFVVDMGAFEVRVDPLIFEDDFESGDTSAWDAVVGGL
jgi:predicted outer membrane repeat protein